MQDIKKFKKTVKGFYAKNRRDLPWRKTRDPYKILVSEVMLQQTQVSRVLQKYPLFLSVFPTLRSLAKAPLADVLGVWQGLGYNRRAKTLKSASEVLMAQYKGKIPRNREELTALPGVGPSTAGGVLAFAYNIPYPFIETNIRRVFIHHFFSKKKRVGDADILQLVKRTLDRKEPREWYYALFDYGTHLARTERNPNRRSARYTKQSPFDGSRRQLRGHLLRTLLKKPQTRIALEKALPEKSTVHEVLAELAAEGFILERNKKYYPA